MTHPNGNGDGPLSDADNEIVRLVVLGVERAVERQAAKFQRWLGTMMLKALAWASVGAAVLFVGWIAVRGQP